MQEVKNALAVYESFERFDPLLEKHLLEAHKTLMLGLVDEAGDYRSGGVGVMSGKEVVHMASPANQESYYQAIAQSTDNTDSGIFAKFMLGMIQKTLAQQLEQQDQNEVGIDQRLELRLESNLAAKILIHLNQQELGRSELAMHLGHQSISGELNKQIRSLLDQQLIERTIPDKPTSSKQKYRLTQKGMRLLT